MGGSLDETYCKEKEVGVYATDFEFVGPSACIVPDSDSNNVESRPLIRNGQWVPSTLLVPENKWAALVDGHKRAERNGSLASSRRSFFYFRFTLQS